MGVQLIEHMCWHVLRKILANLLARHSTKFLLLGIRTVTEGK